jgi:hypothetical protein
MDRRIGLLGGRGHCTLRRFRSGCHFIDADHEGVLDGSLLGEALLRPVVKLGCAWALMRRHLLRVLECAAVREIGGDAGGAECVTTDFFRDAGGRGAPADHPPGVRLAHGHSFSLAEAANSRQAEMREWDAGRELLFPNLLCASRRLWRTCSSLVFIPLERR